MHSFAQGINTRWKNSKQTRWKMFLSYCLWFISGCVCEHEHMYMLVIYIEYQALFMFGLQILNSRKNMTHIQICFFHSSASESQCQWHIFKTTFWHDIKHWTVNIDRRWEQSSWESDLNLLFSPLSSFSNLEEMLSCHVTVLTVCWQKCHFQRPIALILSEQARDSPPNLWQQGVCEVFRRFLEGFRRMMCEYLCLSH